MFFQQQAFMSTSSDLLSKKNVQSWRNLSQQDRRRAATSMFLSIEDVGFHACKLIDTGTSELTVDENIGTFWIILRQTSYNI